MMSSILVSIIIFLYSFNLSASQARLQGLGQKSFIDLYNHSNYINDESNSLLNPSFFNQYYNFFLFESGQDTSSISSLISPKASGTFVFKLGYFSLGFNVSDSDNFIIENRINRESTLQVPDNVVKIIIAGNFGTNWGFSPYYSNNKSGNKEETLMGINLGLNDFFYSLFADIKLINKSTDNTFEYNAPFNFHFGGTYKFTNALISLEFLKHHDSLYKNSTLDAFKKYSYTRIALSHIFETDVKSKVYTDISYDLKVIKSDFNKSVNSNNYNLSTYKVLPINFAFEEEIISSFVLRFYMKYNLFHFYRDSSQSKNIENNIETGFGFSYKKNEFKLDSLLSLQESNGNLINKGTINGNSLFSKVSIRYAF